MEIIPRGGIGVAIQSEGAQRADLVETIEDLKPEAVKPWPPNIAPMPSQDAAFLVGGNRLDQPRLALPSALDPFAAPVVSLRHDYVKASSVVAKAYGEPAKRLVRMLQEPNAEISEPVLSHLRASLVREQKMVKQLEDTLEMMAEINGRVIGGQEG